MMFNPRQTHIIPTIMLFITAWLPVYPLVTTGAYRDTETSTGNIMQAWGGSTTTPQIAEFFEVELNSEFNLDVTNPEVAGTSTTSTTPASGQSGEPEIEISDDPLEITEPATSTPDTKAEEKENDPNLEISEEPLEIVEPISEPEEAPVPEPEEGSEPISESESKEEPEGTSEEEKEPEAEQEEAPDAPSEDAAPAESE